ncbi:MAG: response regulator [Hyphomicrobiales bacterium]|nr:MAG: response regulator [Hyphomicrobiales bacterium]
MGALNSIAAMAAPTGRSIRRDDPRDDPEEARGALQGKRQIVNLPSEDAQAPETAQSPRAKRQRRALDVLVIEDESIIAKDIELIVSDLGHRVIGPARTHEEALSLALKTRPAVVVADVKLADGSSGIVAVDEMLRTIDAAVIFVTAVPQWLQTGELEPVLIVPKPYSVEEIKSAVSRATSKRAQSLETFLATKDAVSRLTRKQ